MSTINELIDKIENAELRARIQQELQICTKEGKSAEDSNGKSDFVEISRVLKKFNKDRDWEQFHNAKDLALSISIEASELNECFLWKDAENASREKVEEELADVFICAIMLADKYGFDVKEICMKKIERNAKKYPVEKAKGTAAKYDELV